METIIGSFSFVTSNIILSDMLYNSLFYILPRKNEIEIYIYCKKIQSDYYVLRKFLFQKG